MNRQPRALLTLLLLAVVVGTAWTAWRSVARPEAPTAPADTAPPAAPARGGTLTATLRNEPRSFNRFLARDVAADLFARFTLDTLVRVNRATDEVEPGLAESWTRSADGRQFTLKLRQDVVWSDGTPFTAADVRFSFNVAFDPAIDSILASALMVDGRPLSLETPDDNTVVVTYPAPFGPGIRLLDNLPIVPAHRLAAARDDGTFRQAWTAATPPTDLAAIGPFVLARYEPGQRLVFERNPHYWRRDADGVQLPYLDRLILEITPDQDAESLRLSSGDVDMLQQPVAPADLGAMQQLAAEGRIQLLELGVSPDPDPLVFNLRPAHWADDPRGAWLAADDFRRALSHAVDREAFARAVYFGAAVPVHGPVSPGNRRWFWPSIPRYLPSTEKARALLSGLGLENRDDDPWLEDAHGTEARVAMLTYQGNSVLDRGAQFLHDEMAAVGVRVDIVALEQGALIKRLLAGDFDAIYFSMSSTDLDPAMQADFWLSSGSAHVWNIGQKTPATAWEAEIDRLMTAQAGSLDPAERERLFRDVQRIFAEHLPVLYFAAPRLYMGVSRRVSHLTPAVTIPQLLWSADTISVTDPATR